MNRTTCMLAGAMIVALSAGCYGPHPETALAGAAWNGRTAEVTRLLAAGTPVDTLDGAWTPLVFAARRGHLDVMRVLLDAGADANRVDGRNGWTPLMHALHKQQRHAALLLLERGANPAIGRRNGFGPLAMAALDNDTALMRAILQKGVPPDHVVRALQIAVSGGTLADIDRPLLGACYEDAVRVLLAAHPEMAVPGGTGAFSPTWWARVKRCGGVVKIVEERQARVAHSM